LYTWHTCALWCILAFAVTGLTLFFCDRFARKEVFQIGVRLVRFWHRGNTFVFMHKPEAVIRSPLVENVEFPTGISSQLVAIFIPSPNDKKLISLRKLINKRLG